MEYGEKIKKRGNCHTHTLEHEIWKRNIEKHKKREILTLGSGMWQKTNKEKKPWKMRHKHCITWNMARNTE